MQRQERMKPQYQDRRLKPMQVENQLQQHPQPQKCPRCDSLNTKFCYYNNYSLSQPRYLCKTCRRYWTQGGTLRNVPVGGGCRKGKRAKQSSQSGDNTRSQMPPAPPQVVQQSLTMTPQHIIFSGTPVMTSSSSYFNRGEELGSSSSWVHSFASQAQCQIQASDIYQMIDHSNKAVSSSPQPAWPESYINNSNSMAVAAGDTSVWTASNSNVAGVNPSNNTATTSYSSSNLNQWPDYMPGFCPLP